MTAFDGWVHDRFGGVGMLNSEALLALVFVAAGLIVLQRIKMAEKRSAKCEMTEKRIDRSAPALRFV
jgi:hypothetical protein